MKTMQPVVSESRFRIEVADLAPSSPRAMLPYLVPMLTFLVLTNLEGYLPGQGWYPLAYAAKVLIVGFAAWCCRSTWTDLRPIPPSLVSAAGGDDRADCIRALGPPRRLVPRAGLPGETNRISTPRRWDRAGDGASSQFVSRGSSSWFR